MIDWEDIKSRHRIEDVLERRGHKLRRSGSTFMMKCPLHNEQKGTSFVIDTRKQLWKCFGKCQCGGDVIKLVMELDQTDATGAAEILEGRPLRPEPGQVFVPRKPRVAPVKEEVPQPRELPFIPKLYRGEARHWEAVARLRKLPNAGGVELAVRNDVLRFCIEYEHPAWAVLDVGNPCNIQVRRMDGALWFDRVKSMGVKGNWARWPVGLDVVMKHPAAEVELVEGTGDFIAAWHCVSEGYANGIPAAMFGASNPIHDGALAILEGRRVRILEQHDEAGTKAAAVWEEQLRGARCEVVRVQIPAPGEDLNDHISQGRDIAPLFN